MGAAQSSRSVLLVDADLSEPDVARLLDLDESAGLKGILAGTASFADVVQPVGSDGLHVITAGSMRAGSTPRGMGHPLLASIAMARFLANARERYDLVVIDTPPMFMSSDSLTLAAQVDGIVVVVDARRTRQRMLTASLRRLTIAGGSVVGIVLNRASPPVQLPHLRRLTPASNGWRACERATGRRSGRGMSISIGRRAQPQLDQAVVLMVITWLRRRPASVRAEPHRAQARGAGQRRHSVLVDDRVVEPPADTGRDRLVRGRRRLASWPTCRPIAAAYSSSCWRPGSI